MLIPLEEHQLLVFWTQLLVLVATARALGWLMRRLGLPRVIGELGAGVILGPTLFGRVWPEGFEWFLPDDEAQSAALLGVAWVGIALLLWLGQAALMIFAAFGGCNIALSNLNFH